MILALSALLFTTHLPALAQTKGGEAQPQAQAPAQPAPAPGGMMCPCMMMPQMKQDMEKMHQSMQEMISNTKLRSKE